MKGDLSMFQDVIDQNRPKLKNTQGDLSMFGYTWKQSQMGAEAATEQQQQPQGFLKGMVEQVPPVLWDKYKAYNANEKQWDASHTFAQQAKRDLVDKPAKIVKFVLADLPRYMVGVVPNVAKSLMEFTFAPMLGKDYVRENFHVIPGSQWMGTETEKKMEKLIFGDEVKTYQQMSEGISKFVKSSPDAQPWEKKFVGPTTAAIALVADIFPPGKGTPKKELVKLFEELAVEASEKAAYKRMVEYGIPKDVARAVAVKIPQANTPEAVRDAIGETSQDVITLLTKTELPPPQTVQAPEKEMTEGAKAFTGKVGATADSLATRATTRAAEITDEILTWARGTRAAGIQKAGAKNYNEAVRVLEKAGEAPKETKMDKVTTDSLKEFYTTKKKPVVGDSFVNKKGERVEIVKVDDTSIEYFLKGKKKGIAGKVTFDKPISEVWDKSRVQNAAKIVEPSTKKGVRKGAPEVTVGDETVKVNDGLPKQKLQATDEEVQALKDLTKKDKATLRPTSASGDRSARNLAEEMADNIKRREQKIKDEKLTPDEIADLRKESMLEPETLAEAILRGRGVITDKEAIERAKRIGGTLEDVISLPKGTVVTKEQYTAIQQIIREEEQILSELSRLMDEGGTGATAAEKKFIASFGDEYAGLSEQELLLRAYEESLSNLKKAWIVDYGLRSEAGRSLQATKQVVGEFNKRMRFLYNRINGNAKYTTEEKQSMLELVNRMNVTDDKEFLDMLQKVAAPDWFDKFAEYSVAAKLWNPTTHVVNFAGNTLRQVVDMGITTVTDPRAIAADMHGAMVGFKRGVRNAVKAFTDEGYATKLAKYAEVGGTAPAIGGKLGYYLRTPFRLLGASDEIFKATAYQRRLHRDAWHIADKEGLTGKQLEARMTELLNSPTLEMSKNATEESKHLTFQDDMGEIMKNIEKWRTPAAQKTKGAKLLATGVRMFIPFLKTPTNLFKQSIDFSPLGLAKNFSKMKAAAKAGDQATVRKIIGEATVGSAIIAFIAMEAADGNVTGGFPRDASKKDKFYREKKLPYAIKMGDQWYEYKRIDPFASIIALTADMTMTEDKSLGSLINIVSQNLQDKTYLSGLADLAAVWTGDPWERDAAIKSAVLGAAFPSIVGHVARSADPTVRSAKTVTERMQALVPGMSQELPARVNVIGGTVQRANKGLNYFFNPIQSADATIDPVTTELMNLDKSLAVPDQSFERDKIKYTFTSEQYEDFAKVTGLRLYSELQTLFASPQYQRMSQEDRENKIDKIRRDIQTEYKDLYIKYYGNQ